MRGRSTHRRRSCPQVLEIWVARICSSRDHVPPLLRGSRLPARLVLSVGHARGQQLPEEGWIVWASNREDARHGSTDAGRRLEREAADTTAAPSPPGSPDGAWIAYQATDGSVHVTRSTRARTSRSSTRARSGLDARWLGLFVSDATDTYHVIDPDTGSQTSPFKKSDFARIGSKSLTPAASTATAGTWSLPPTSIAAGLPRTMHLQERLGRGRPRSERQAEALLLRRRLRAHHPPSGSLIFHVCGSNGQCSHWPTWCRMDLGDLATRSSYATEVSHDDTDWGHEYFRACRPTTSGWSTAPPPAVTITTPATTRSSSTRSAEETTPAAR